MLSPDFSQPDTVTVVKLLLVCVQCAFASIKETTQNFLLNLKPFAQTLFLFFTQKSKKISGYEKGIARKYAKLFLFISTPRFNKNIFILLDFVWSDLERSWRNFGENWIKQIELAPRAGESNSWKSPEIIMLQSRQPTVRR